MLAEWTGLEPATPGVTGRYSNQLNYHSTRARRASLRAAAAQTRRICRTIVAPGDGLAASQVLVGADGLEPPTFAL